MAVKYLVSANGETHLPVTGDDGKPDHRLMGAAWAALHEGYRGNKYEGPEKQAAITKLTAMYKSENMDTPSASASHSELENQWVPIFCAGEHTSMEGMKRTYTERDLQHIATSYNPDYHEAPAVVGHPKDDAPAYGWVGGLKHEDGTLFAKFREVNPDFDQLVQSGALKKRSASFYVKPDGLELRHVAFLGAMPPAVKGLANIKFEEGEIASIEFQEGSMANNEKPIGEQIADYFKGLFGGEKSGVVAVGFSEADAKRLIDAAVAPLQKENADLKVKLDQQAVSFAERERKILSGEHSGRVAEAVNKLRTAGAWVPAFEKMGLKLVFAELAKSSDTIEFGEGDAKQKLPALDILVSFLEKLKKIVPGGILVKGDGKVLQFSESSGSNLPAASQNSVQLRDLARVRQREKSISYSEALDQVAEEHPELTVPGQAAAGAV